MSEKKPTHKQTPTPEKTEVGPVAPSKSDKIDTFKTKKKPTSKTQLPSTGEQLQTPRKVGQSTNEELQRLIEELQNRNVELNQTNDDMNNLLTSTRIPVIMLGKNLRIRRFTPAAQDILKLNLADVGRPISDITTTLKLPNLSEIVSKVIASMQACHKDIQDENTNWYAMDVHPYRTSANEIDGAVIVFTDITVRKKEERKFRTFLESSPNAMIIIDELGKICFLNSEAEARFGYDQDELLGEDIEILVPAHLRASHVGLRNNFISAPEVRDLAEGRDLAAVRKDGSEFKVEISLSPIESDDGLLIAASVKDVTVRREGEIKKFETEQKLVSKFRALLESAPNAMVVINREGIIQTANTATQRLFGYDDGELEGRHEEILIPKRFHKAHPEYRRKFFEEPESRPMAHRSREIFGIKKDGTEFPAEVGLSPIEIEDEIIVSCSIQDLTDRRAAEKILVDARLASESANLLKSEFLANMSHEIRTPLTSIVGFSQKIAEQELSAIDRLDAAHIVKRNANHLQQLINDVLDLSKVEAGKIDIESTSFSLIDEFAELWLIFSRRASKKRLQLKFSFDGPIPEKITSDPTRFRQIVTNILGNAIKFTEKGGIHVSVKLITDTHGIKKLQILVRDSGIGILRSDQSRLFSAFVQADTSVTRKFGGTGLGLVLSRHLAKALGGNVELLESSARRGSVFSILIDPGPLDNTTMINNLTQSDLRVSKRTKEEVDKQLLSDTKILLVEDSPDIQMLVKPMLESVGAEVTLADNGEIGVVKAETHPYDLILMDMQMPVLDGLNATKMLRNNEYPGPIVALTARMMREEVDLCIEAGCNEVVAKPINFKKLIEIAKKYTGYVEK